VWLAPPTPPRSLLPDRARVRTSRRPKLGGTSHASHRVTCLCLACSRWAPAPVDERTALVSPMRVTRTMDEHAMFVQRHRKHGRRRGKGRLHEHQRLAASLALLAVHSQRKGDGPPIRPGHHPFPPPPPSFLSCKVASKPGEKKSEVARHAVSDAVESAGKRVSEGKKNTVQQGSIRSSSHARRIR